MNNGLSGFPHRPSRSGRLDRLDANDVAIGTPVARTKGYAGTYEQLGICVQVGRIKAVSGLWGIGYCPVDDRIYACANSADGQVVVANTATARVERRFHVGPNPIRVEYVPSIGRVLFLRTDGVVVVYDPRRRAVVRKVASGVASPTALVFCPSNGQVYVVGSASAAAAIDPVTWAVSAAVIPAGAQDAVYSPMEDLLYLACAAGIAALRMSDNGNLGVYHASSSALHHIAISPVSANLYACSRSAAAIYLIVRAQSDAAIESPYHPGYPLGAAVFSPKSFAIYGGQAFVGGLSVFDMPRFFGPSWGTPLSIGNPRAMAYCPSDGRVYAVSETGPAEIAVIN